MDAQSGHRHGVALVTDNKLVNHLVKNALPAESFDVFELDSGAPDLLEAIAARSVSAVVIKPILNSDDGLSLCRTIKNQPRFRNVRVIFASSGNDLAEKAIQNRADDYLPLPATPAEILALVPRRRATSEARTSPAASVASTGRRCSRGCTAPTCFSARPVSSRSA